MKKTLTNPFTGKSENNEVSESAFFKRINPPETSPTTKTQSKRTVERPNVRTSERSNNNTPERPNDRTVKLPKHRITKRYSFEFYEDQIISLKKLRFAAEMRGENFSMSEIVRIALDEYLNRTSER